LGISSTSERELKGAGTLRIISPNLVHNFDVVLEASAGGAANR